MTRGVSVICAVVVVMCLVSPAWPAEQKAKTPEQTAWENVDCLNKPSLQDFLKSFPEGELAPQAKVAIELQDKLVAFKEGKIAQPFILSPEVLGATWKQWQKSNPNKAAFGYSMTKVEGMDTPGKLLPSPLSGGKTVIRSGPTGDGSIIAVSTHGLKYELFPGIVFETPGKDPMYFAVVAGKGLVHLKGTGTVTLPDGRTADLEPMKRPDVVFVPTPQEVVDKMLEMAQVNTQPKRYWTYIPLKKKKVKLTT